MATTKELSPAAMDVLAACTVDGNLVRLPASPRLERKLYEEVNEALTRLGGKWKGGKTQAHVFEDDPSADLRTLAETGEMPPKNPMAFFATPPSVVAMMEELLTPARLDFDGAPLRVLEPSAGDGALLALARKCAGEPGSGEVTAIELDTKRARPLRATGLVDRLVGGYDFLTFDAEDLGGDFHLVVMNPPFTTPGDPLAYITHIRHAYGMLVPGGRLVSVAPSGFTYRKDRRSEAFRKLLVQDGGWRMVPAGAFKESGTGVETVVLWLDAPQG